MGARFAYVDAPGGQLHYAEDGGRDADSPVILLLHQCPRSHDEFRELMPLLAPDHRVIAMDMPGYGQSHGLPAPQTIEDYARGALDLLDALAVPRATVLGHHTGAAVALEVAAAAPDRVEAVVLSSAPWADEAFRNAPRTGPGVDDADRDDDGLHLTTWWAQRAPHYPAPVSPLLDRLVRDALAPGVDPREGHLACRRYVMERRAPEVRAPALVLTGDADPFALPALDPLADALTGAASVSRAVIPGGTLALMERHAAEVAGEVRRFLGSLDGLDGAVRTGRA
ncbi:alpha/beta fold hydrolase [Actinomycetospora sp. C-140]